MLESETGLSFQAQAGDSATWVTVFPRGTHHASLTEPSSRAVCGSDGHASGGDRQVEFSATVAFPNDDAATDTGVEKQQLCLELGAEKWIDFKETTDLVKAIKDACDGLGPHATVVTSPYSEGYSQAVDYLRPGGTLMAVGLPADAKLEASIFWTVLKVRTMGDL